VREEISFAKKKLSASMEEAGFNNFSLLETGSLVCGHYNGPKPKHYSLNDNCPFQSVIECDLRVVLPYNVDILSKTFRASMEDFTGIRPEFTVQKEITRFGSTIPMMMGYFYKPITEDLGLEFEVCFNKSPYFEIAEAWHKVFSPEEIEHQRLVRASAARINLDYKTEFFEIKAIQAAECRYRICAAVVHNHDLINLYNYPTPIVNFLTTKVQDNFLEIDRPFLTSKIDDKIKEKFKRSGLWDVVEACPRLPDWLLNVETRKGMRWAS
jgi:hypothetical protein